MPLAKAPFLPRKRPEDLPLRFILQPHHLLHVQQEQLHGMLVSSICALRRILVDERHSLHSKFGDTITGSARRFGPAPIHYGFGLSLGELGSESSLSPESACASTPPWFLMTSHSSGCSSGSISTMNFFLLMDCP